MIKRSEFYAFMIIIMVMFCYGIASAVSYQVSVIQPTNIKEATFYQETTTGGTYYTSLNTTGKGILSRITFSKDGESSSNSTIKVTIDGGTPIELASSSNQIYQRGIAPATSGSGREAIFDWLGTVYFKTSLKIEQKHTNNGSHKVVVNYATE